MSSNKKNDNKELIKELRKKNFYLKIENFKLKNELKALKNFNKKSDISDANTLLRKQAEKEKQFSKKHYLAYVISLMKESSFFKIYSNFVTIVRKYSFITTSLKILAWVFILLQSSAIFVLSASAFFISLPFAIFISYLVFFTTFLSGKRSFVELKNIITGKKVYLLFPAKDHAFQKNSFFFEMAQSFARNNKNFIIIVSPFFFNSTGFQKSKKFFLSMRKEDKNIVIIRRHYYFLIKKSLYANSSDTVEIY